MHKKFWLQSLNGEDHSEELGADGRIVLEWILGKQDGRIWIRFIWLRTETGGSSCEHGDESSGSIKGRVFFG
jgi:hypothetical protein